MCVIDYFWENCIAILMFLDLLLVVFLFCSIRTYWQSKKELKREQKGICYHDSFFSGVWEPGKPFTCEKCNKTF